MSQSSVIFGALLIGFIVFITVRGELPQYLSVLFTSNPSSPANEGAIQTSSSSSGDGILGTLFGGGSVGSIISGLGGVSVTHTTTPITGGGA